MARLAQCPTSARPPAAAARPAKAPLAERPQGHRREIIFAGSSGAAVVGVAWISARAALAQSRAGRRRVARLAQGTSASFVAQRGDTVAVVGAGGNVGRLVTQRLTENGDFQVRAVLRDAKKAKATWAADLPNCELFEADTRDFASLATALKEANSVICTTGVPAFGFSGQWEKGNHPESVDHFGVKNAVHAWADFGLSNGVAKRRFVVMSSIGVTRRSGFPYSILNGGGVLDAKASGEQAVKDLAQKLGFAVAIVRPGQLFGGPYVNNRYLGTLFQLDKDAETRAVRIVPGDTAVGDTLRSSLAGVLLRCLASDAASLEFAVVNDKGEPPSEEAIDAQIRAVALSDVGGAPDEQLGKRLDLSTGTFAQAFENVVSGKVFKRDEGGK